MRSRLRPVPESVKTGTRAPLEPGATPDVSRLPPTRSSPPAFIKRVATRRSGEQIAADEFIDDDFDQDRDPGRALERLRQRASGESHRGRAGAWSPTNESEPFDCGLGVHREIEVRAFVEATSRLEYNNGQEHDVFFDPDSGRVVKLTRPGKFGAKGGPQEYLQRLAWSNEFFDDDWLVEGWLRYPNEAAPRVVTSQPWYRVNPDRPMPTMAEIDAYMWRVGFLKAYDGAWIHSKREIVATDALPKNFVIDVSGFIQPIDLILYTPGDEPWDRLQNMARNLPQVGARFS
ncbi:MAG: hypothetical protein KDK99_07950 [Verrucomicrobiales bacterium]|nr:hypothetical protein [Verrucomicrobiales bacterium]